VAFPELYATEKAKVETKHDISPIDERMEEQNHISIFWGSQGKGRQVGEILFLLVSLKTDFQTEDQWDLILQWAVTLS